MKLQLQPGCQEGTVTLWLSIASVASIFDDLHGQLVDVSPSIDYVVMANVKDLPRRSSGTTLKRRGAM